MKKLNKKSRAKVYLEAAEYFSKPIAEYGFCHFVLMKKLRKMGQPLKQVFPEMDLFVSDSNMGMFFWEQDDEGNFQRSIGLLFAYEISKK